MTPATRFAGLDANRSHRKRQACASSRRCVQHRRLSGTDVQLFRQFRQECFGGPGEKSVDLSAHNSSTSRAVRLEFRGEFFNALNHAVFSQPDASSQMALSRGSNHFNRDSTASDSICVEVTVLADCFRGFVTLTMILGMSREVLN